MDSKGHVERLSRDNKSSSTVVKSVPPSPPTPLRSQPLSDVLKTLLRLKHEDIVINHGRSLSSYSLKGSGEENKLQFILACTLTTHYRDVHRLTILSIADRLASAIHFMHSHGIFHGNISSKSVILKARLSPFTDVSPSVKILLEASNTCTDGLRRNSLAGDIRYVSPESVLVGCSYESAKHDSWMLGALIYEMCTGFSLVDYYHRFPEPSDPNTMHCYLDAYGSRTELVDDGTMRLFIKRSVITALEANPRGKLVDSRSLVDLLKDILVIDPSKRPTVAAIQQAIRSIIKKQVYRLHERQAKK